MCNPTTIYTFHSKFSKDKTTDISQIVSPFLIKTWILKTILFALQTIFQSQFSYPEIYVLHPVFVRTRTKMTNPLSNKNKQRVFFCPAYFPSTSYQPTGQTTVVFN